MTCACFQPRKFLASSIELKACPVAHKLGLCDRSITVHMPGGKLSIEIGNDFSILMTGPVTKVSEGTMDLEMFDSSSNPEA